MLAPREVRELTRASLVATVTARWSWEGVARHVIAAAQGEPRRARPAGTRSPARNTTEMSDGLILLITGALLTGGLAVSLLAGRLRVPGLVLVLGLGMAIGSDGLGWIAFNDYRMARRIGIVALSLILFEGGLAAGGPTSARCSDRPPVSPWWARSPPP